MARSKHFQAEILRLADLVDGRLPGREAGQHCLVHSRRIGGHALGRDAMRTGENRHNRAVDRRAGLALPGRDMGGNRLQPSQCPARLDQLCLARGHRRPGGLIRARQGGHEGADIIERQAAGRHGQLREFRPPAPGGTGRDGPAGLSCPPFPSQPRKTAMPSLSLIAGDLLNVLRFYTRLPLPVFRFEPAAHAMPDFQRAAWAIPITGMVVGLFGALAGGVAYALGLSTLIAATLAVTVQVVLTAPSMRTGWRIAATGCLAGRRRSVAWRS